MTTRLHSLPFCQSSVARPLARCLGWLAVCLVTMPAWASYTANTGANLGTVTDNATGLVWDQSAFAGTGCTSGTISGTGTTTYNWQPALQSATTANQCSYKGYSDWRLPNVKELESLVLVTASNPPAVDPSAGLDSSSSGNVFWSSTSYTPYAGYAWAVDFGVGTVAYGLTGTPLSVRLVRGGPLLGNFDAFAPVVSATSVSAISYQTATLHATSSASGNGYYVVVTHGSFAPTSVQVKTQGTTAGTGSYTSGTMSVLVAASGKGAMTAAVAASFALTGLIPATAYDVYFVADDSSGNLSALAGPIVFATLNNATTTTVTNTPTPLQSAYGNSFNISVSIVRAADGATPNSGSIGCILAPLPSGTPTTLPAVPVSNGAATCTVPATQAAGSYSVTASFTDTSDSTFASSSSTPVALTINPASQTLTFPVQSPANQTFASGGTFAINPFASSATPNSGNGIVYSSLTTGVCTVSAVTVTIVSAGSCTLAADEAAGGNYAAATQVTQNVTISAAPTTVTLSSKCMTTFIAPPVQPFTYSATVSGANPTGSATFSDGNGVTLCNAVALNNGTVTCTTQALVVGAANETIFNLKASYNNDANHLASASVVPLTVELLSAANVVFRNGFEAELATCPIE